MRIFFDTEFIDDGKTVDLISIGLVRDDGAEYYAESAECDLSRGCEWVQKNVIPHLTGNRKPRTQIAADLIEFCGESPQFWAYYASYDWLCLCQLYGRMLDTPFGWPHFVFDVQVLRSLLGVGWRLDQVSTEHNALNDAKWTRDYFNALMKYQQQMRDRK